MLCKKLEDAFNEQITKEFYSAYLYLSMASYFERMNLPGFANWMRIQFQEEQF
ncbi:MAG: ferritin, partial [Planctomycetes bacterium]|nr:ferritin [Planctomycetota bacterium]